MSKKPSPRRPAEDLHAKLPEHIAAVVEILRAADKVRRKTLDVVSPHGLSLAQFNALRILQRAPEGLSTMEVSERLVERSPGITRIIDGLVDKQLVTRLPHPEDRRSIVCALSDKGIEIAELLEDAIDRSDRELTEALSSEEISKLARLASLVGGPRN